ncbi:YeeE/YedE family protein [Undibacterium sp. 5I1]|uniref:YeeE/YedE family protein n=1 Tax=unclassified Undibacterium TaxID=2630295 RepID=UPI002AB3BD8A|nr:MULTISPECIES: YeeE/YedE family protein [unclassified Undibacterium]MDY7539329.1 YeeE/YedE family protein [Undibacterium sp. 5I1]MEB0231156.1 YeeE/YedE family protein [Undibacterium sp. 10I3]MEB0258562.1 YeeE/YedE family protein [Undibacterium sp. 5I1]
MNIEWAVFTPVSALLGGALIGLAASLLILMNGRVAGISGIVAGLLRPVRGDWWWRLAFVLGLLSAPLVYGVFATLPIIKIESGWPAIIIAGLLVGIGTRYGSGCTSGHGVCGLSRLSPRSLMATIAFMAAGFVTVFILRHGLTNLTGVL